MWCLLIFEFCHKITRCRMSKWSCNWVKWRNLFMSRQFSVLVVSWGDQFRLDSVMFYVDGTEDCIKRHYCIHNGSRLGVKARMVDPQTTGGRRQTVTCSSTIDCTQRWKCRSGKCGKKQQGQKMHEWRTKGIKSNQIKSNLFPNAKTVHTANM